VIVAVSGIRDLSPQSYADVELAIIEEMIDVDEMRFGGALGVDTVALRVACELADVETTLVVIVPCSAADQPREAREAFACASRIVELGLPRSRGAYLRRNDVLLDGADKLIAFTDGRATGGTAYTIERATRAGLDVRIVPVSSNTRQVGEALDVKGPAPIFAPFPYRSAAQQDWRSEAVRGLKVGVVDPDDFERLADELAQYIQSEPELSAAGAIVPMPRRQPGLESDLLPLAQAISERTGQEVLRDWLVRTEEPTEGAYIARRRTRFPAEEHERTMRVAGSPRDDVLILDNVITMSGTMIGAQLAVERDTGVAPPGLAVLKGR
jgi:hypothetical protein